MYYKILKILWLWRSGRFGLRRLQISVLEFFTSSVNRVIDDGASSRKWNLDLTGSGFFVNNILLSLQKLVSSSTGATVQIKIFLFNTHFVGCMLSPMLSAVRLRNAFWLGRRLTAEGSMSSTRILYNYEKKKQNADANFSNIMKHTFMLFFLAEFF